MAHLSTEEVVDFGPVNGTLLLIMIAYHKILRLHKLFMFALICGLFIPITHAYDSPNFDSKLLDADALLISEREKENLTEALVSVASNFPDSELIDEDIREKAMAIALFINPLSPNAREAHASLSKGKRPRKTAYYKESVSEVSEALWSSADRIIKGGGEPEGEKLAVYLREISLVISPKPPGERFKYYAKITKGKNPSWGKAVTLQPDKHESNNKIKNIYVAIIRATKSRPTNRPDFFNKPARPDKPPRRPDKPNRPNPSRPTTSLALEEVEIPFVSEVRGTVRTGYQAGMASFELTEATSDDDFLFRDREGSRGKQMPLVVDNDGLRAFGFPRAEYIIRKEYPKWPEKVIGNIMFSTEFQMKSSPRTTSANMSIAGAMLLYSAFSGEKALEEMSFAGSILGSQSNPHVSLSTDNMIELLEGGKLLDREFLLVPETAYDTILKGAVESRRLDYLFDPQLISYKDWDQLKSSAYESSNALAEASKVFKEIQAVQDKMPLVELAKNQKVQERLNTIIAGYPQHLSARVMLEFGKTPDDPKALVKEAVRQIDEVMDPIYKVIKLARDRDFFSENMDDLKDETEDIEFSLQKLDSTINQKAKGYLKHAREVADNGRKFLSVTNFDTSLGRQRVKEFRSSFELLEAQREILGLGEFDF